jgi:hypothetical protein
MLGGERADVVCQKYGEGFRSLSHSHIARVNECNAVRQLGHATPLKRVQYFLSEDQRDSHNIKIQPVGRTEYSR